MKFLKNKEIPKDPRGQKNVYGNDYSNVNFGHLNPSIIITLFDMGWYNSIGTDLVLGKWIVLQSNKISMFMLMIELYALLYPELEIAFAVHILNLYAQSPI